LIRLRADYYAALPIFIYLLIIFRPFRCLLFAFCCRHAAIDAAASLRLLRYYAAFAMPMPFSDYATPHAPLRFRYYRYLMPSPLRDDYLFTLPPFSICLFA